MASNELTLLVFVVVAVGFSLFYGFKAEKIFSADFSGLPASAKFHQFWLNFLGSALGWVLLGFGLVRLLQCAEGCPNSLGIWDAALLLGGFIGATGHLPIATITLIQRLVQLVSRYADKP